MPEHPATAGPAEEPILDAGPVRPRSLLLILQIIALVCLVIAALLVLVPDGAHTARGTWVLALVWGALAAGIGAAWILRVRLRSPRARAVLALVVVLAATPVAVFGRVGFTVPVLLLVVALVVLDVSVRAGVAATCWIGLCGMTLHVLGRADVVEGLLLGTLNTIPVMVLLCFGIVLGWTLRAYEQQLRRDAALIGRLRRAAETEKELLLADERARSARELHDGLGHRLTLVSMSLDFAERSRGRDAEAAWEEVARARTTSQEALDEMRTWVRALSPVRAASARGAAALDAIAESFRGTGLEVDVSVDDPADSLLTSDDALSLLAYRAVQEGLTNALRHGRARAVRLDLAVVEDRLRLRMSNDLGPGADVPEGEADPGFGLHGIAERAGAHGGSTRAGREGDRFVLALDLPTHGASGGRTEPARAGRTDPARTVIGAGR